MQTRTLGNSGIAVSALGYGAMSFSDFYGPTSEAASHALLDLMLESGVTHLDTSNVYGNGRSETWIGSYLRDRPGARARFVIATKAGISKDAEGKRKLNEAENLRSEDARRSAILEGVVSRLPEIIREQVKPMEKIESIKILQVDGLPGLNSPSERSGKGEGSGGGDGGGNIPDQVVNSAMKYRTQVAFVDGLMEEIGLPLKNLGAAGGMQFKNVPPTPGKPGSDDSDD